MPIHRALPLVLLAHLALAAEPVRLESLDLSLMTQGWGQPQVNRSIREQPLKLGGKVYEHGVGTHARSELWLDLALGCERFQATVGCDDNAGGAGTVTFEVWGDGKSLFNSGVLKPGQPPKALDVDLRGVKQLLLLVGEAGDGVNYDHGDWCDAVFLGGTPKPIRNPEDEAVILTPKPGPAPRLNNALVYGCRPGHPFLYRIPCQGERPLTFTADNLPPSVKLDARTGILTGTAPAQGEYAVVFHAANRHGQDAKPCKLVVGDTLALTPPMGWNHWYAHYDRVTDAMMRQAADLLVSSGMADVGYSFVDIDDCWMNAAHNKDPRRVGPLRDAAGRLVPNKHFPDMTALAGYVHSLGLKAGLYSSPGPRTCAGFAGSWQHEAQDAATFADWGFDLLKYDWCSYGEIARGDQSLAALRKPYQQMGDLLRAQPRDIQLNLCQYGMGQVWQWGRQVGGQSWRTGGDLGFELNRIFEIALRNCELRAWNGPGGWNDPDYIQIGHIGAATAMGQPKPCPLTPNEQYSFVSLWCLTASPLFFSGDMASLDEFTLNVLCNPEVLAINQDPLGQCAAPARLTDTSFLLVKDLADGSKAVGLCNRGEFKTELVAPWAVLGVKGPQAVRDLWRQRDLGKFDSAFRAVVPRHGVVLVRLTADPGR